jgi:phosphoserine phosphatase RsbX
MEVAGGPSIEFGAATRTLQGQEESGDLYLVKPTPGGVLVAAVDGLGHGPDAAAAARIAVSALEHHAHEPVAALLRHCHDRLIPTRGVVMSLAFFHDPDRIVEWVGVGNVEGLLLRADPAAGAPSESLLLRSGVVGARLPTVQATLLRIEEGDTLIFATDGIRGDFTSTLRREDPPQQIADRVLARHHKGTDDALVLVARYLGNGR